MNAMLSESPDVVLIGAGIMSATLGTLLSRSARRLRVMYSPVLGNP